MLCATTTLAKGLARDSSKQGCAGARRSSTLQLSGWGRAYEMCVWGGGGGGLHIRMLYILYILV